MVMHIGRYWAMFTNSQNTQRGYSLVELVAVMVIIGILVSLVVVLPTGIRDGATDQDRADDMAAIGRKLENSYDNQTLGAPAYPSTTEFLASATGRTGVLQGIDEDALKAPNTSVTSSVVAATTLT